MPLTPIFHPQEDWYQAMVTKNKGSLKATNRQEEWYEEIVDSMSSGSGGGGSSEPILVTISNNVASMTSTEIKTAISEGKIVYLRDGNLTMYEITTSPSGSPNAVVFTYNYLNSGSRVQINDDGSIVRGSLTSGTYNKPSGGIPESDLAQAVKNKLNKFVVTLTLMSADGGVADKTNAEIAEAFENGKSVWFTGNMGGMDGWFPLKAITYISSYEYPFIGTEFDMITMSTTTISSTSKYMVAMSASDTPNNVFAMKAYPLDTPSANGVSF